MKEKFYRFMQGRYGNDQFNRFLMILVIVCFALSLFGVRPFYVLGIVLLIYAYFRLFSKNIYKRRQENAVYLRYEYKVRQWFATFKRDMEQRKTHHIYRCPSCGERIADSDSVYVYRNAPIWCPCCGQSIVYE